VIGHTSVSFVVISLQEGIKLTCFSRYPLFKKSLVIFYLDTSINATQMKNHLQMLEVREEKGSLHRARLLQNKRVINAYNPVYLVMVVVLAVRHLISFLSP
jgi:hypothetical protein